MMTFNPEKGIENAVYKIVVILFMPEVVKYQSKANWETA